MIPKRYAPALFSFVLSGLMSLLISGLATWRAVGLGPDFLSDWGSTWVLAWLVAFPSVMVAAPLARRVVDRLTS